MNETSDRAPAQCACTIRAPMHGDCGRMAELAGQLGYPSTADQVRARLSEIRDSKECAIYVADLSDGQVGGWIGVYIFRSVEMDKLAEINGLVVGEEIRSRGIGRVLLAAAEKWARDRGCATISVHSNVKRERAHDFYKRNGYEWHKTQESFRKHL
ncbi:MAG TPA: GNAT family N-acetyltransferase [Candidatus Acidoferrales bacterium]|nr:GNAT family N-acetyltransferase [Candidatus Acidoferrales bacterium]